MIFTVAAVSDVVHVVAGLLAEQASALSTRHMESLFTSGTIARHARTSRGAALTALLLAQVACFQISVCRHQA